MVKKNKFKIGSKFVDRGTIFRVFKIEKKKINGDLKRIIHYRPFFKNPSNETLICSSPEPYLLDDVRKPTSKNTVYEIIRNLSITSKKRSVDTKEAKSILNMNDIQSTVSILKIYWRDRKKEDVGFTKTKRDILDSAIDQAVEEIAFVLGISLSQAKNKILIALED